MLAKKLLLIAVALFATVLTYPQDREKSSDQDPCAGPRGQQELNQCMAAHYKEADQRLNKAYELVHTSLNQELSEARVKKDKELIASEEAGLKNLQEVQRAWSSYRDLHCAAAQQRFQGGSMAPMVYAGCMWKVTDHRTEELRDTYWHDVPTWGHSRQP